MRGIILIALIGSVFGADTYDASIEQWRRNREERLKADDGWLTVAGLFWLKEGLNRFGSDPSNDFVFPEGSVPARAGVFEHRQGRTVLRYHDGGSQPTEMRPDSRGAPTVVRTGRLQFWVIQRGKRFAIRLRDQESAFRRKFTKLEWYPVNVQYRVSARFVAFPEAKKLMVPSITGDVQEYTAPGYVEFILQGKKCRLEPAQEGNQLFFIFKDTTTGKSTYPAGRFLYTPLPEAGQVVVDFNKAYNPPCAFTPYATCPLPPEQNGLPVAVEAGEKTYHLD